MLMADDTRPVLCVCMLGYFDWGCRLMLSSTKKGQLGKREGALTGSKEVGSKGKEDCRAWSRALGRAVGDEEEREDLVSLIGKVAGDKDWARALRRGVGGVEELVARVGKGRRRRK